MAEAKGNFATKKKSKKTSGIPARASYGDLFGSKARSQEKVVSEFDATKYSGFVQ